MSNVRIASFIAMLFVLAAMIGGCATLEPADYTGGGSASPDVERAHRPSEVQAP